MAAGPAPSGRNESAAPSESKFAVDLRVFMVGIMISMSASFLFGVSVDFPIGMLIPERSPEKTGTRQPFVLSADEAEVSKEHHPSGQHLLVDILGVDADFLNSEERLAKAMVDVVLEAKLTLLSYHCHSLTPSGISCVGVLMESHISFHTWPEEGVITLDLFTCGPNPLLPVVPTIERLFGVGEDLQTRWSHELRGFRPEEHKKANYLDDMSDLAIWVLSPLEVYSKVPVYSNMTKYQRVDIWDIIELEDMPSYEDGVKWGLEDGDERWASLQYTTPDRLLFLDGTIQSTTNHEKVYHEALVHPPMFAHPNPKNVAILGGGEGGTIREVLKHNTVEKVTMIEIDAELIALAREFLPDMSNCSNIVGRAPNCFDDEIVDIILDDGLKWFLERFGPFPRLDSPDELYDVIILDALDPEDDTDLSEALYADSNFISALINSLSDDGVLQIQVGTAPSYLDPRSDLGPYNIREQFFLMFEKHRDVEAMLVYEEPRCGFLEPHAFLVVCKSATCRNRWFVSRDMRDYDIFDRILQAEPKGSSLLHYDGTTQYAYQYPPKAWETVYCRREPMPFECSFRSLDKNKDVFELSLTNEEESSFRLQIHEDDSGSIVGTSIFAKENIPAGSYIMPHDLALSVPVTKVNIDGLKENIKIGGGKVSIIEEVIDFVEDNGHKAIKDGVEATYVEVGGTLLIRDVDDEEEANVGRWLPSHPSGRRPIFSPVYDRNRISFEVFMVAIKDISAGSELLTFEDMWDEEKT